MPHVLVYAFKYPLRFRKKKFISKLVGGMCSKMEVSGIFESGHLQHVEALDVRGYALPVMC